MKEQIRKTTMTGEGTELADVMERRKTDILGVLDTKWKASKEEVGSSFSTMV